MSEYSGFMTDVVTNFEDAFNDSDFNTVVGEVNMEKLDYPAVHIIPDRVEQVEGCKYNIYVDVFYFFESLRNVGRWYDHMEDVEDTFNSISEELKSNSGVGEYKPVSIENFAGSQGGSIILGIEVNWRVTKLIDFENVPS